MLRIFTAHRNFHHRHALDCTRGNVEEAERRGKSAGLGGVLAPSRELLNWGLGEIGKERLPKDAARVFPEYQERYRAEMRLSYQRHPTEWAALLARNVLILTCYCKMPAWCHRTVAAELLVKAARGQAVYCGELWEDGGLGALSLYPEWAWAVAYLGKDIENRDWQRHSLFNRWLAIHGGKSIGGKPITKKSGALSDGHAEALDCMIRTAAGAGALSGFGRLAHEYLDYTADNPEVLERVGRRILAQGCGIVALARVGLCVERSDSRWFFGPYGFELQEVAVLSKPVPCSGAQGLWPVQREMVPFVIEQLRSTAPLALRHYLDFAGGSLVG
jgi:uncharacterized protein YeaO (DUF488 family)